MKKIKRSFIYVVGIMFLMMLFAPFETSELYEYADKLNLQPDRLYLAYADKPEELSAFIIDDVIDESPGKAESYSLGDNSPFIREYKIKLSYLGFIKYPDSNIFDSLTEEAVKEYQNSRGLEVTGILDTVTMNLLDGEEIIFKSGDTGEEIGDYQAILSTLGYLDEYESEKFDDATKNAVGEYQADKSIEVTYTLNQDTKDMLKQDMLSDTYENRQ